MNEPDAGKSKEIERRLEKIRKKVRAAIEGKCAVVYSVYQYDETGLPVDNLNDVAISGRVRAEDEIWDSYVGEDLENPTWLELTIEANRMIIASNDYHHVYFENIQVMGQTEDGIRILSLDFGS